MVRRALLLIGLTSSLGACGTSGSSDGGGGSSGQSATGGGPGTGGTTGAGGSSAAGGGGGTPASCASSSAALRDCVDPARLIEDLNFIAQPRSTGTPHWQTVQDLCRDRFQMYGFEVELHNYGSGVNVIGRKPGTDLAGEDVVFSAHYDSTVGCPGADDNASGVAGVLEMARLSADATYGRSLVLACWDEEERGLIGARAYAARAASQGQNIHVMISLEMLSFRSFDPGSQRIPPGFDLLFPEELAELAANENRGDFLAIFPDTAAVPTAQAMAVHAEALGLPNFVLEISDALKANPLARDVQRSDHAAFWAVDIPAIMATDTSEFRYTPYHCRNGQMDVVPNLDMEFFELNVRTAVGGFADTLQVRTP